MGFFSHGFSGQPEHLRAHQQLLEQSLPHMVFEGGNRVQVSVGQGRGGCPFPDLTCSVAAGCPGNQT